MEKHCRVGTKVVVRTGLDPRKRTKEKKHVRMTYVSIRRSSLEVRVSVEKHRRIGTKVVVRTGLDTTKSPRRK